MARGKTKGATSYVSVPLKVLNQILRPEASVLVSRRFSETLGLDSYQLELANSNEHSSLLRAINKGVKDDYLEGKDAADLQKEEDDKKENSKFNF